MQPGATACNLVQQDSRMRKTNPNAPESTRMHRFAPPARERAKRTQFAKSGESPIPPLRYAPGRGAGSCATEQSRDCGVEGTVPECAGMCHRGENAKRTHFAGVATQQQSTKGVVIVYCATWRL